jgi:putative acetyltransferase
MAADQKWCGRIQSARQWRVSLGKNRLPIRPQFSKRSGREEHDSDRNHVPQMATRAGWPCMRRRTSVTTARRVGAMLIGRADRDRLSIGKSACYSDVEIRPATPADAEAIINLHFAAVHQTAAAFYTNEVLDTWSTPPDERRYQRIRNAIAKGDELFVVAEDASEVIGFGSILPSAQELHAVYVHPKAGRRGIGARILIGLERLAVERGLSRLQLDASLNAEAFYRRAGYEVVERGLFQLGGGVEMGAVKMRKELARPARPQE